MRQCTGRLEGLNHRFGSKLAVGYFLQKDRRVRAEHLPD